MALIICPGCDKQFSEHAIACPSCHLTLKVIANAFCPECRALVGKNPDECKTCGYPFFLHVTRENSEEMAHAYLKRLIDNYDDAAFVSLIEEMTIECVKHALDTQMSTDSYEDLLTEVQSFLDGLFSIKRFDNSDGSIDYENKRLWVHDRDLWRKSKNLEQLNREAVAWSLQEYLSLPIRTQKCDRFLIEVSLAGEISAFSFEMLHELPDYMKMLEFRPHRKQKYQFKNIVLGIGKLFSYWFLCIGILLGLYVIDWLSESVLYLLGFIITLVFGVIAIAVMISGPFFISQSRKEKKQAEEHVIELLNAMDYVYRLLEPDELISAKHLESMVYESSKKGVVWPRGLYHMLDDVNGRSGKC